MFAFFSHIFMGFYLISVFFFLSLNILVLEAMEWSMILKWNVLVKNYYLVLLNKKNIAIGQPRSFHFQCSLQSLTSGFQYFPILTIIQKRNKSHIHSSEHTRQTSMHCGATRIQTDSMIYDLMAWRILTIADCENWKLNIHTAHKTFELWMDGFKNLSSNAILHHDKMKLIVYSKNIHRKSNWNETWNLKLETVLTEM